MPNTATNDSFTTTDNVMISGNVLTNDVSDGSPLTVSAVNGSSLAVGVNIVLASGARLQLDANGHFIYDPSGSFDNVSSTTDSFTYTVAGGTTATVTIAVNDAPSGTGTNGPDTITGTAGDDLLNGLYGDDILYGLGGNDELRGGPGNDRLVGGTGNDIYYVDNNLDIVEELVGEGYDIVDASGSYTLAAGLEIEELRSTLTNAVLTGNELDNVLRGYRINGGAGNDQLYVLPGGGYAAGGTGDDTYWGNATVTEASGEGYDVVKLGVNNSGSYYITGYNLTAGASVERIEVVQPAASTSAWVIQGNEFDNVIVGAGGNDTLWGKGGIDTLIGGDGSDTYYLYYGENALDIIIEQEGAAAGLDDGIRVAFNYELNVANVENVFSYGANLSLAGDDNNNRVRGDTGTNLLLGRGGNDWIEGLEGNDSLYGGEGNDNIYGGDGNDLLAGENGNDRLDGETGTDTMTGGAGDDTYYVDSTGDVVIEDSATGGTDTVYTSISYSLAEGQYIETVIMTASGTTTLNGNSLAQTLFGGSGNDTINGRGGADILAGGNGSDVYIVDSDDRVFEFQSQGGDTVYALGDFRLESGQEIERLSAFSIANQGAINLSGNEFKNVISGTLANNVLSSGGGSDILNGFAGDDTYYVATGDVIFEGQGEGYDVVYTSSNFVLTAGQAIEVLSAFSIASNAALNLTGNSYSNILAGTQGLNVFDGGGGGDVMSGFGGDDIYYARSGDIVFEQVGEGYDTVYAMSDFTLTAGQQIEMLSAFSIASTDAMNLTGNGYSNILAGTQGANTLDGGGGGDVMSGFGGNDIYYARSGDVIFESAGQGSDTVYALGNFTLTAGQEVEMLSAASIANQGALNLTGNEFANAIVGTLGNNVLDGKGGADYLIGFAGADTYAFTSALGSGVDIIDGFETGVDKIALDDAIFAALAPGALAAGAFVAGSVALGADDRILYDQASGALYYDADGSGGGAAVQFATLLGAPGLHAADFVII